MTKESACASVEDSKKDIKIVIINIKKKERRKMKIFLSFLIVATSFILWGCDPDNSVQSTVVVTEPENPDSVVVDYHRGSDFMIRNNLSIVPGLRIDSVEVYNNPPSSIAYGRLIIYYNNQLVDSIRYGGAYHWPGYARPMTSVGQLDNGRFLIRIQNEHNQMYSSGKSFWYYVDASGIRLLPKDTVKIANAIYEQDYVNMGMVKKINNRIIFYGYYYCNKETFCTFDLNGTFKNYRRSRTGCYDPWQWE